jgi:hypothetical protein
VHGQRIKCQLFKRDQYGRIVALPLLSHRRWWSRNLPLEMVRAGWGVVYTGLGAEYGGWGQDAYLAAQAEAQYVALFCFVFVRTAMSELACKGGEEGHLACGHEHRDARRVQETAS